MWSVSGFLFKPLAQEILRINQTKYSNDMKFETENNHSGRKGLTFPFFNIPHPCEVLLLYREITTWKPVRNEQQTPSKIQIFEQGY